MSHDEIELLERELRLLDEKIAKVRHELIWRKREVRPGFAAEGVDELEARYLTLSEEFTTLWQRWSKANAVADAIESAQATLRTDTSD